MKPTIIFVNSEGDLKQFATRAIGHLQSIDNTQNFQTVDLLASGHAIELAIKVAMLVKNNFKSGIHQIISTNLHLTEKGEPLNETNKVDQKQLQWMMKGSGLSQHSTCMDRF